MAGNAGLGGWNSLALALEKAVITEGAFDSQNIAFRDADRAEYRAYYRDFRKGYRAPHLLIGLPTRYQDHGKLTWENDLPDSEHRQLRAKVQQ